MKRHADATLIDAQLEAFGVAFLEDKSMIEAQQQVIDRSPGRSPMTLQFDRSVAHFRRLLAVLIREEQAASRAASTKAAEGLPQASPELS